jgi:GT2 family glycosyltransferase
MKIIALIVTHNRLSLLKEAVAALQQQTIVPHILVVNNGSTDGTTEWLTTQALTVISQQNLGASGGFYTGIRAAYEQGADWIWVMDDDTIPHKDALQQMMHTVTEVKQEPQAPPLGFLVSKAIWTDGTPHWMNLPEIRHVINGKPFCSYDQHGMLLVHSASFVSVLLSREAIQRCGYPIREFFIWADDTEFTTRITRAGFLGGYVPDSVVLHKTATNYSADLFTARPTESVKHFYGIRNKLYCRRIWKGEFSFWSNVLKNFLVIPLRIFRKRKDHRWLFIRINWKATWAAVGFKPVPEKA